MYIQSYQGFQTGIPQVHGNRSAYGHGYTNTVRNGLLNYSSHHSERSSAGARTKSKIWAALHVTYQLLNYCFAGLGHQTTSNLSGYHSKRDIYSSICNVNHKTSWKITCHVLYFRLSNAILKIETGFLGAFLDRYRGEQYGKRGSSSCVNMGKGQVTDTRYE